MTRLAKSERTILELLRNGEMTGIEMLKASKDLKRGIIYVRLDMMEEKGFVTSYLAGDTKDGRLTYRITRQGHSALHQDRLALIENAVGEAGGSPA